MNGENWAIGCCPLPFTALFETGNILIKTYDCYTTSHKRIRIDLDFTPLK